MSDNERRIKRIVRPASVISACKACDYFRGYDSEIMTPEGFYSAAEPDRCLKMGREVKNADSIPDWCPLENN
jgi:hypothetical protein